MRIVFLAKNWCGNTSSYAFNSFSLFHYILSSSVLHYLKYTDTGTGPAPGIYDSNSVHCTAGQFSGSDLGLWELGTLQCSQLILAMTLQLGIQTKSWVKHDI